MPRLLYNKIFHNDSETKQEYTDKWAMDIRKKREETRRKNRAKRKAKSKPKY
ncbi:hypothetical protein [Pontibacter sp. H249]|uniref:hypothetical protein n=1 Tax=Pontibacter sp. H249 TaxID=3133420 RepID=UPI0030BF91A2